MKNFFKKIEFIIPVLALPLAICTYFVVYIWWETSSIGCLNCTYEDIHWEAMILSILSNGLLFSLLNRKSLKKVISIALLTISGAGVLIYMYTFHIFVNYEEWLQMGMIDRWEFIYNKQGSEQNILFDLKPFNNLFITIFGKKGRADIYASLNHIEYRRDSVLTQPADKITGGCEEQFFAMVRLFDNKTRKPAAGLKYSAASNETNRIIVGQTDQDGCTAALCTQARESVSFQWGAITP